MRERFAPRRSSACLTLAPTWSTREHAQGHVGIPSMGHAGATEGSGPGGIRKRLHSETEGFCVCCSFIMINSIVPVTNHRPMGKKFVERSVKRRQKWAFERARNRERKKWGQRQGGSE